MKLIKFQVIDGRTDEPVGPQFSSFTEAYHRWQYETVTNTADTIESGNPFYIRDVPVEADMAGF